jgi:hypothetical protein
MDENVTAAQKASRVAYILESAAIVLLAVLAAYAAAA